MIKKLNIYIIRHGEKTPSTDIHNENNCLTERGKKQVKLLAKRLETFRITKIYSSDLLRCKETAEIIKKELGLPIEYEESLREIPSKVKENPRRYMKKINEIRKFWNKINKMQGNILLVGSGIVNRIFISFALNIDPKKANFMQHPTGLTKLEKNYEKRRYRVWHINDTSHLTSKLRVHELD